MKKVLVSGAAGFIGSHLVDTLFSRGTEVMGIDNFSTGHRSGFNTLPMSITDVYKTQQAIKSFGPDAIIHLAALSSNSVCKANPRLAYETNVAATQMLAEFATDIGARIVFASTSYLYAEDASLPYTTKSALLPETTYAISKLAAEYAIKSFANSYAILRYANVYGPRQVSVGDNQLIAKALAHKYRGEPFSIFGSGKQKRDYVYVQDVVNATILAAEHKKNGVWNIGGGEEPQSINYVLAKIWPDYAWRHSSPVVGDRDLIQLAPSKGLDWKPLVSLDEGLQLTESFWEANEEDHRSD